MGLLVPNLELTDFGINSSNITLSNAYVAIADQPINIRNFKSVMLFPDSNTGITSSNNIATVQMEVYYGVWDSYESRTASNFPLQVITSRIPFEPSSIGNSNIFDFAYTILKETYSNSTNIT